MVALRSEITPDSVTTDDSPALITFKASYPVCFKQYVKHLWFDHIELADVIHYAYQHCVLLTQGYKMGKLKNYTPHMQYSKKKANKLCFYNQQLTDIKLKY